MSEPICTCDFDTGADPSLCNVHGRKPPAPSPSPEPAQAGEGREKAGESATPEPAASMSLLSIW